MEKKKIVLLSPFPGACTLRKNMVQKQLVNHKDSKEMRLWEAASKKVTGKSTMQTARHTSSCMIFENVSSREVQCFFNKSWVPELKALPNDTRGIWCQGQRGPAVGTEEAEKEDWGGKKLRKTEDRPQQRNMSEFVRARKTSLDTRNLTAGIPRTWLPGLSPVSLQAVGEKKMMAALSAIMDITSHPLRFPHVPRAAP